MIGKQVSWIPVALGVAIVCLAQSAVAQSQGALELRLQPGELRHGVPQAFTFILVNSGGHDVRVPPPAVECDDLLNGAIRLELTFLPLKPGPWGKGTGCSLGHAGAPAVLDRAKDWKLLHPGESLSFPATKKKLLYETRRAGTYEFRAEYFPPDLTAADKQALRDAGIDFPHEKLTAGPQKYQWSN